MKFAEFMLPLVASYEKRGLVPPEGFSSWEEYSHDPDRLVRDHAPVPCRKPTRGAMKGEEWTHV